MPVTAYRVCRRIYARLDGEEARRVSGRWNSPGRPVVYMAQSVALAVLENLVHMSRQDYPTGYVVVEATIPDHVRILDSMRFLDAKSSDPAIELRAGDEWLVSGESAVVQADRNYLINPEHRDFAQITSAPPVPMHFDERLFERNGNPSITT
jgi:RES domain-containing protein